jgi:hypothetical protein
MTPAPWQLEARAWTARAWSGRLPHALLVGPAASASVRCRASAAYCCAAADGTLRALPPAAVRVACAARSRRNAPDGSLAQPYGHPVHPDASSSVSMNDKSKKMYGELVVDQILRAVGVVSLTRNWVPVSP